jgi:hypothetical protein
MIGVMYFNGRSVLRDDAQAVDWWRKAAAQGQGAALQNLGVAYSTGRGVGRDLVQAAQWWRKAADTGNVAAINSLAAAYSTGAGVDKDPGEAARLWRQAADRGDAPAQHALGVAYHDGAGVPPDLIESYKWLYIAALRTAGVDQRSHIYARDAVGNMTSERLPGPEVQSLDRRLQVVTGSGIERAYALARSTIPDNSSRVSSTAAIVQTGRPTGMRSPGCGTSRTLVSANQSSCHRLASLGKNNGRNSQALPRPSDRTLGHRCTRLRGRRIQRSCRRVRQFHRCRPPRVYLDGVRDAIAGDEVDAIDADEVELLRHNSSEG